MHKAELQLKVNHIIKLIKAWKKWICAIEILTKLVISREQEQSQLIIVTDKFLIFSTIYISMENLFLRLKSILFYWVSAKNEVLL